MKEKEMQSTHHQKELFLRQQLSNRENELEKQDKLTASLQKQVDGYKEYIEELKSELKKLTLDKTLQRSERN